MLLAPATGANERRVYDVCRRQEPENASVSNHVVLDKSLQSLGVCRAWIRGLAAEGGAGPEGKKNAEQKKPR